MDEQKDVKELRREASRERMRQRLRSWTMSALLAEAFLVGIWPVGATIALLTGIVFLGLRFYLDKDCHFRHLPLDVPVGIFAVVGLASVLVAPEKFLSFYNYYNLVGAYLLTYLLAGQVLQEPRQFKQLLAALGAASVIVLLYGFQQYLFGIDISDMKWVDGEAFPELRKRVFSTWENPNILAGYLDIVICLALGLMVKCGARERRILMGVLMAASAACLAMTYARGACLVMAVILAGYGIMRDLRLLAVCAGAAALLLVVDPVLYERLASVFTKVDTSTEMRMAFWESTIAMIQDHPFLGIGWGAYYLVYPEYDFYLQGAPVLIVHAHNLYLNYAAEIGLPGALAFMWFFFGSAWLAFRAKFSAPEEAEQKVAPFTLIKGGAGEEPVQVEDTLSSLRTHSLSSFWEAIKAWPEWRLMSGLSLGLGLAFVSVALNGLTDDLLFNIPTSMLFWLLAATAGSLTFLKDPEPEPAEIEPEGESSRMKIAPLSYLFKMVKNPPEDAGESQKNEPVEESDSAAAEPEEDEQEKPAPGTDEKSEVTEEAGLAAEAKEKDDEGEGEGEAAEPEAQEEAVIREAAADEEAEPEQAAGIGEQKKEDEEDKEDREDREDEEDKIEEAGAEPASEEVPEKDKGEHA